MLRGGLSAHNAIPSLQEMKITHFPELNVFWSFHLKNDKDWTLRDFELHR